MIADIPALTQRSAWQALAAHYSQFRNVHLRQLFADDPQRGERFAVEGAGLYLDYSKHRVTDETLKLLLQLAVECDLRQRIDAMFRARRSTSRSTAPCCTWRCVRRAARRSWSTGRTSCPRSTRCWTGWPTSRTASAAAPGPATPASASATSSTSASAGPTSA